MEAVPLWDFMKRFLYRKADPGGSFMEGEAEGETESFIGDYEAVPL